MSSQSSSPEYRPHHWMDGHRGRIGACAAAAVNRSEQFRSTPLRDFTAATVLADPKMLPALRRIASWGAGDPDFANDCTTAKVMLRDGPDDQLGGMSTFNITLHMAALAVFNNARRLGFEPFDPDPQGKPGLPIADLDHGSMLKALECMRVFLRSEALACEKK